LYDWLASAFPTCRRRQCRLQLISHSKWTLAFAGFAQLVTV
jgi:hypothetical protein